MDRFDLINELRTFATSRGWHFIFGSNEYASADFHNYAVDELVLVCDITPLAQFSEYGGAVQSVSYSGVVMLGRKFEAETCASLDETMLQKHDNRLKDLWTILSNNIGVVACSNGLALSVSNPANLINFYSTNIDFVKYDVTFTE